MSRDLPGGAGDICGKSAVRIARIRGNECRADRSVRYVVAVVVPICSQFLRLQVSSGFFKSRVGRSNAMTSCLRIDACAVMLATCESFT